MIVRNMLDIRVPICKVCQGALDKKLVIGGREKYNGHLYFCVDCGTEYKIIGPGQSDNELYVEYDNGCKYLEYSKVIAPIENGTPLKGEIISFSKEEENG